MCVSVSDMDSGSVLCGRPYGGCAILYRKSFPSCVVPITSCFKRFCAIKLLDSSGLSLLVICLYMPAECQSSSFADLILIHLVN